MDSYIFMYQPQVPYLVTDFLQYKVCVFATGFSFLASEASYITFAF